MPSKPKAQYSKPSSQLDLEARLKNENQSSRVLSTSDQYVAPKDDDGRDMRVEGNDVSGYIGTDPVYQNYANDTEQPAQSEEGAEKELEKQFLDRLDANPDADLFQTEDAEPAPQRVVVVGVENLPDRDEPDDDQTGDELASGAATPAAPEVPEPPAPEEKKN